MDGGAAANQRGFFCFCVYHNKLIREPGSLVAGQ